MKKFVLSKKVLGILNVILMIAAVLGFGIFQSHDLQPVYGNKDRLWVSTGSWLYQYVKSTKSWNMDYPGIRRLSRANIKSVGNPAAGQPVIQTVPNNTFKTWCTNTVEFFNVSGEPAYETRKRDSMAVYKARYLNPDYQ